MFLAILVFVLAIALPFALKLAMLPADITNRALVGVAIAIVLALLVGVVWRRLVAPPAAPRVRVPDPATVGRLQWPANLSETELEAFCTAFLRGQGWAVAPVVSNAASGLYLELRRDGAHALMMCDATTDAPRPALVRAAALVARDFAPARPVLARQAGLAFSRASEQAAREHGVVLVTAADLPDLADRLAAARASVAPPEPAHAATQPRR
jgi:hypothetical protein